jgi:hypothetical protein
VRLRIRRLERLVLIDFGGDASRIVEPSPGADDGDAAIVAVTVDVDAGVSGDCGRNHPRRRHSRTALHRFVAGGKISARIVDQHLQDRLRIVRIGEDTQPNKLFVEATVRQHEAVFVEGVGLARLASAAELENPSEVALRIDAQAEYGDDLQIVVAHRLTNMVGTPVC